MPPVSPTLQPPPTAAPASAAVPWWVPPYQAWLAFGLYAMSFWLLYVLAPAKGEQPSELFKTLAGAIVITAFINGVVAAVFTASRDSQKKNDTIAAQAQAIASQAAQPTP